MKTQDFVLTLIVVAFVLFFLVTNLKLTAVLAGAVLASALIKRACGPMAGSS
jgi:hypothetical protein